VPGKNYQCLALTFISDFSNYWTAAMYFKHQNGSYKRVPIYPNAQLGMRLCFAYAELSKLLTHLGYEGQDAHDIKGGMTIYYTQKDFNSSDLGNYITAFPPVTHSKLAHHLNQSLIVI
jgi:hypothetical protein